MILIELIVTKEGTTSPQEFGVIRWRNIGIGL